MRPTAILFTAFCLGSIVGCSDSPTDLNPKLAPVGGVLVRLPNDRGMVAIKTEAPELPAGPKLKNRMVSIVAYFYQMDGTTPLTPAPTDVVFTMGSDAKTKTIPLNPDAKDPNRFLSAAGPYMQGIQGMIKAKVQGVDVEESFSSM